MQTVKKQTHINRKTTKKLNKSLCFTTKKTDLQNIKRLLSITAKHGFGNKIFDIIIALYFNIKLNCNVFINLLISKHEVISDPSICDIFPALKQNIVFIDNATNNKLKLMYNINSTKYTIEEYVSNFDNLGIVHFTFSPSRFYYYIFNLFNNINYSILKKMFHINLNYISKYAQLLSETTYCAIHIRLGDKLKIVYNDFDKQLHAHYFILFTPEYYNYIIKKIKKTYPNINIYIFTDTASVVKKYIIDFYNISNVKLINTAYLDTFYLLINADYLVGSISTFSYSAFMLSRLYNKNQIYYNYNIGTSLDPYYILDYTNLNEFEMYKSHIVDINHNNKFLLNNNKKLLHDMISYSNKN